MVTGIINICEYTIKYIPLLEYFLKNEYNINKFHMRERKYMAFIKCPLCGEELNGERICKNCGKNIGKLEDVVCKNCNGILEKCPKCGNQITASTDICSECGYNIGSIRNRMCKCCDKNIDNVLQIDTVKQTIDSDGKNKRLKGKHKLLLFIPCVILIVVFLVVYTQVHIYADATCIEPKTCKICRKTEGNALNHQWLRECEKVETCKRCGMEQGEPIEHNWKEATCTEAKTCSRCKKTDGEPLGHNGRWSMATKATLTDVGYTYEICERCNEILNSNKFEKKKPKVEGDHFNFGAVEFIKYFDEYLNNVDLNVDAEVDAIGTLIADNPNGGVAFSTPVMIDLDKKMDIMISQNKEEYVESMYIRGSNNDKSSILAIYAVIGASLTDSSPQKFLVELFDDAQKNGVLFYGRDGIRFTEVPDDNSYVLAITPIN